MKIGFDAKRAFNNHRGLGNYSRDTIRILSTQFTDNQYFLYTPKISSDIPFQPNENCRTILPNGFLAQKMPSVWRTYSLADEAQKEQLDLFHGLSHELPVGIQKKGIPTVVTMHDLIFMKFPELYPAIDRALYKHKYISSCNIADRIIAISEQTKRDLLELTDLDEQKIDVVYQGCSPTFRYEIPADEREQICQKHHLPSEFMLSVGALEERKNHIEILRAMVSQSIDFPLVIIGNETDYTPTLHQYIEKNKLQSRVTLLTGVPFADFPAIYQSATLMLYPSLFEGFGIPVLEALCSGTPVIAATGSCLEESGGPGSCYVSPTDCDELGTQIRNILGNIELQQKMIAAGKEYFLQFTDEAIAQNLWTVYQKSISAH